MPQRPTRSPNEQCEKHDPQRRGRGRDRTDRKARPVVSHAFRGRCGGMDCARGWSRYLRAARRDGAVGSRLGDDRLRVRSGAPVADEARAAGNGSTGPSPSSSSSSRRRGLGTPLCRRPDRARGEVLWRPRRHRCSPPNAAHLGLVAFLSTGVRIAHRSKGPTSYRRGKSSAQSAVAPSGVLSRLARSRPDRCQPAARLHGRRNDPVERPFCRLEVCQACLHARLAVRRKRGSGC
jgi:hypothetical protein